MRLQSKLAVVAGMIVLGVFPAVAYSVCVSGARKLLKQQAGG